MPRTHAHLGVFRRDGGPRKLIVTVGELKEEVAAKPAPKRNDVEKHSRYGLALSEMSASLKKNLEIDNGVSIIGVEDGQARNAGLRPGDVILEVDGKRVSDIATFHRLLEHASPDRPVVLRVRRGMTTLFLAIIAVEPT
jgi:serine protease Do